MSIFFSVINPAEFSKRFLARVLLSNEDRLSYMAGKIQPAEIELYYEKINGVFSPELPSLSEDISFSLPNLKIDFKPKKDTSYQSEKIETIKKDIEDLGDKQSEYAERQREIIEEESQETNDLIKLKKELERLEENKSTSKKRKKPSSSNTKKRKRRSTRIPKEQSYEGEQSIDEEGLYEDEEFIEEEELYEDEAPEEDQSIKTLRIEIEERERKLKKIKEKKDELIRNQEQINSNIKELEKEVDNLKIEQLSIEEIADDQDEAKQYILEKLVEFSTHFENNKDKISLQNINKSKELLDIINSKNDFGDDEDILSNYNKLFLLTNEAEKMMKSPTDSVMSDLLDIFNKNISSARDETELARAVPHFFSELDTYMTSEVKDKDLLKELEDYFYMPNQLKSFICDLIMEINSESEKFISDYLFEDIIIKANEIDKAISLIESKETKDEQDIKNVDILHLRSQSLKDASSIRLEKMLYNIGLDELSIKGFIEENSLDENPGDLAQSAYNYLFCNNIVNSYGTCDLSVEERNRVINVIKIYCGEEIEEESIEPTFDPKDSQSFYNLFIDISSGKSPAESSFISALNHLSELPYSNRLNITKEIFKATKLYQRENGLSEAAIRRNIDEYTKNFFNNVFYEKLKEYEKNDKAGLDFYRQFKMFYLQGDNRRERDYEKPNHFAAKLGGFLAGRAYDERLVRQGLTIIDYIMIVIGEKENDLKNYNQIKKQFNKLIEIYIRNLSRLRTKKEKDVSGIIEFFKFLKDAPTETLAILISRDDSLWSAITGLKDKVDVIESKTFSDGLNKASEIKSLLLGNGLNIQNIRLLSLNDPSVRNINIGDARTFFNGVKRSIEFLSEVDVSDKKNEFQRKTEELLKAKEDLLKRREQRSDGKKGENVEKDLDTKDNTDVEADFVLDRFISDYFLSYLTQDANIEPIPFYRAMSEFFSKDAMYILNNLNYLKEQDGISFEKINKLTDDFKFLGSFRRNDGKVYKNSTAISSAIEDILERDQVDPKDRKKYTQYINFVADKIGLIKFTFNSINNSNLEIEEIFENYNDLFLEVKEENVKSFSVKDDSSFKYDSKYKEEQNRDTCGTWISKNIKSKIDLYSFFGTQQSKTLTLNGKRNLKDICENKTNNGGSFNSLIQELYNNNSILEEEKNVAYKFLEEFLKPSQEFYGKQSDKKDQRLFYRIKTFMDYESTENKLFIDMGIESSDNENKIEKEFLTKFNEFVLSDDFKINLFKIILGWNNNIGEFFLSSYNKVVFVDKDSSRKAFSYCCNKIGFYLAESIKNNYEEELDQDDSMYLRQYLNYYDDYISGKYSEEAVKQREDYRVAFVENIVEKQKLQKYIESSLSSIRSDQDLEDIAKFCLDIEDYKRDLINNNQKPTQKLIAKGQILKFFSNTTSIRSLFKFCDSTDLNIFEVGKLFLAYDFEKIGNGNTYKSILSGILKMLEENNQELFSMKDLLSKKKNKKESAGIFYKNIYNKMIEYISLEIIVGVLIYSSLKNITIGDGPIDLGFLEKFGITKDAFADEVVAIRTSLGLAATEYSNIDFSKSEASDLEESEPVQKYTTLQELENAADGVYTSNKDDPKFVFIKGTDRVPTYIRTDPNGRTGTVKNPGDYHGIKIISDFYEHKSITSPDGDYADIILVDKYDDILTQFNNYRAGGAAHLTSLVMRKSDEDKDVSEKKDEKPPVLRRKKAPTSEKKQKAFKKEVIKSEPLNMRGELSNFLEENYTVKYKNTKISNAKNPFTGNNIKVGELYDALNSIQGTVNDFCSILLDVDVNNLTRQESFDLIKFISNNTFKYVYGEDYAKLFNEDLKYIYELGQRYTNDLFDFLKKKPLLRTNLDYYYGEEINLSSALISVLMMIFKDSLIEIGDASFKIDLFNQVSFRDISTAKNIGPGILLNIYQIVKENYYFAGKPDLEDDMDKPPFERIMRANLSISEDSEDEESQGYTDSELIFTDMFETYEEEFPELDFD